MEFKLLLLMSLIVTFNQIIAFLTTSLLLLMSPVGQSHFITVSNIIIKYFLHVRYYDW